MGRWHESARVYIPFDQMPNAVDPPSGFLATANSRVTTDKSPYPLTLEWVDPYRAERIYKSLDGRDGLTPKDMLAVQTDIYSEVDQELGQRLAYAIDHTDGVDERLRKAADLMRSWDGRLTTDSAAASIVTQARQALWPLILEPKLGKDAADYRWAESNFAEEEIVMHAKADWLPPGYKNWDALLTEAVRKGMEDGKAPGDVAEWSYGSWHVVDIEHPLAGFLPLVGAHRRNRAAAAERRHHHGEAGGPRLRPLAALHHGLEQHRRLDGEHCAGRERQSAQPLLPRPVERLVRRNDLRASLHAGSGGRADPAHAAAAAMKEAGIRDQGSGIRAWQPQVSF